MYKEAWYFIAFVGFTLCLGGNVIDLDGEVEYQVFTGPENWHQALINCKSKDMELASITSEDEQNHLHTYLKDHGFEQQYWIGGTRLGDGKWYWTASGTSLVYTFWPLKQSNYTGDNGENCINVASGGHDWTASSCIKTLGYICQASSNICNYTFHIVSSGTSQVNLDCTTYNEVGN